MFPYAKNYEQAIEFLFGRVNFERLSGILYSADDFKLDRMREFLRLIGNPHEAIPAVHVAGTKGKGSTAAFLAGALSAAGHRPGLFTSPHVTAFEERMAVDGACPSQAQLAELVNSVAGAVAELDKTPGRMSPTYFEITTAMAWLYFRERQARAAVLEVGMGGRLDATNVCRPAVTLITTISRDHTRHLGSRIEQIAREKAGIIKPGVPVVCGVTHPAARAVIGEVARMEGVPVLEIGRDFAYEYIPPAEGHGARATLRTWRHVYQELTLPLVGAHQAANAAMAAAALECLRDQGWEISRDAVARGISQVRWPGRIEILQRHPTVIVDAAHNRESIAALLRTLDESFPARRRVLVFAATRDKDIPGILRQLLPRFESVILTTFQNNPRGVPVEELAGLATSLADRHFHLAADAAAAWKLARHLAGPHDLVCVTGSFFLAAEIRELILGDSPSPSSAGPHAPATQAGASPRLP